MISMLLRNRSPEPSQARFIKYNISAVFLLALALPVIAQVRETNLDDHPGTATERFEVIREHYAIFSDALDPRAPRLQVHLSSLVEYLPTDYVDIDPQQLVSIEPQGRIVSRLVTNGDSSAYGMTLRPTWIEYSDEDLARWQQRLQDLPANASSIPGGIVSHLAETENRNVVTVAIDTYNVTFSFDGRNGSYMASSLWFRDSETGEYFYFIADQTLSGISDLQRWLAQSDGTPTGRQGEKPATGTAREKSSTNGCIPRTEVFYYPDLPGGEIIHTNGYSGEVYITENGEEILSGDWVRKEDIQLHENGGHHIVTQVDLTCHCTADCNNTASLKLRETHSGDYGKQKFGECHSISPAQPKEGPPITSVAGDAVYAYAGVGAAFRKCRDLGIGCFCGDFSVTVGLPASVGNVPMPTGSVSVSTAVAGATTMALEMSVRCPACTKLFQVIGEISGLPSGEEVEAILRYDETGFQSKNESHNGGEDHILQFRFDDKVADDTDLEMTVNSISGDYRCTTATGWIAGEDKTLRSECTCVKTSGCTSEAREVLGDIGLDASATPDYGIEGVVVQMTANPPVGSTDPPVEEQSDEISVGPGGAVSVPFSFSSVLDGWEVGVYATSIPENTECFTHGGAWRTVDENLSGFTLTCRSISEEEEDELRSCEYNPELCEGPDGPWFLTCVRHTHREVSYEWSTDNEVVFRTLVIKMRQDVTCWIEGPEIVTPVLEVKSATNKAAEENYSGPSIELALPVDEFGTIPAVPSGQSLQIQGSSVDPDGVNPLIHFYLDGTRVDPTGWVFDNGIFQGWIDTSSLALGTHRLEALNFDLHPTHPAGTTAMIEFEVVAPDVCDTEIDGPQVSFTPLDGETLSSASPVAIDADVGAEAGIDHVNIFVDGDLEVRLDNEIGPWHHDWNASDGEHLLLVRAFDKCGNQADERHWVTVCGGPLPPSVSITAPAPGASLEEGDSISLSAVANDDDAVSKVVFYDQAGAELGRDTSSPFSISWQATLGTTQIEARAFDDCGHQVSDFVGVSVAPAEHPVLAIRDQNQVPILNGGDLSWGTLAYGADNSNSGWRLRPIARNDSAVDFLEMSWQLIHSEGSGFSMAANGLVGSLAAGAEDLFVLRLDTERPGVHRAQLLITHNDTSQPNPFVLNLVATVRDPAQIEVSYGANVLGYDGTKDWGSYEAGSGTKNRGITVKNVAPSGAESLEWSSVELTNLQGSAFTWSGQLVSPLAAGESDNFAISFDTSIAGDHQALVKVWHSDPVAPNPHRFYVTVEVTPPPTQTVEFPVIEDASVIQVQPTSNFGQNPMLYARATLSGQGASAYLKFSVSGLQGTVQSATLRIRTAAFFPTARLYWIQTTTWGESWITWQNAPLDLLLQRPLGSLASETWQEIDVTDIVSNNGLYTLGLSAADQAGLAFYSAESGFVPTLSVTYRP